MPNTYSPAKPLRIPKGSPPAEGGELRFSFKYLAKDHARFGVHLCSAEFLVALLEAVQHFSTWSVDDFTDMNNNDHRHLILFEETTEQNGFELGEQLETEQNWQFQVREKTRWRVHGFMIDETFYVVWLDPSHQLYPHAQQKGESGG